MRLRAKPSSVVRKSFQVQALPVPNDTAQCGKASQLAAHGFLANAQGRIRPLRGYAARAQGRCLRPPLRVRCAIIRQIQPGRAVSGLQRAAGESHWPFTTKRGRMRRSSRSLSFVEYLLLGPQPGARRDQCHVPGGSETKRRPGQRHSDSVSTIPGHVHPPTEPSPEFSSARLSSFNSAAQRPAQVQVASADETGRVESTLPRPTAGFTPAEDSRDRTRRKARERQHRYD